MKKNYYNPILINDSINKIYNSNQLNETITMIVVFSTKLVINNKYILLPHPYKYNKLLYLISNYGFNYKLLYNPYCYYFNINNINIFNYKYILHNYKFILINTNIIKNIPIYIYKLIKKYNGYNTIILSTNYRDSKLIINNIVKGRYTRLNLTNNNLFITIGSTTLSSSNLLINISYIIKKICMILIKQNNNSLYINRIYIKTTRSKSITIY